MDKENKYRLTLSKDERLNSKTRIDKLFSKGKSFIAYPLRVVYLETNDDDRPLVAAMFNVPKRRIKLASKRVPIRRHLKEAYRINKYSFFELALKSNCKLDIAFIYLKNEKSQYCDILNAIDKSVSLLNKRLTEMNV